MSSTQTSHRSRSLLLTIATAFVLGATVVGAVAGQGAAAGPSATFSWQLRPTGTTSGLRGLAAVDESTAWVSGSGGTVLRREGDTWKLEETPTDVTLFGVGRGADGALRAVGADGVILVKP